MDLSLIPTDDLIDALKRRYDCLVVAGTLATGTPLNRDYIAWEGDAIMCQGLACEAIRQIQDYERDPNEGDDEEAE